MEQRKEKHIGQHANFLGINLFLSLDKGLLRRIGLWFCHQMIENSLVSFYLNRRATQCVFIDKRHELNLRRGKVGRIINVPRDDFPDSGQEAMV